MLPVITKCFFSRFLICKIKIHFDNGLWKVSLIIHCLFGNNLSALPVNKKCISFLLLRLLYIDYVSKNSSSCEKEIIFLMTPSWEIHKERGAKSEGQRKWHYLAVWILSAFLWGRASKNNVDFYCLNCIHSFRRKKDLNCKTENLKIKIFVMYLCFLKTLKY